jgi:hypothetical protein
LSRRIVTVLAALATASAVLVSVPGGVAVSAPAATSASARATHSCSREDADKLRVKRWVTLDSHKYAITHADRVRLDPGASFDRTRSVSFVDKVSTNIEGGAEIHSEAGAFFAKASVTVKASVAHLHESTTTRSVSDTFHIPARKRAHRYVFYEGVDFFRMHWHRLQCRMPHGELKSGKLKTYTRATFSGVARCSHGHYKRGSEAYAATLAGGC